MGKIFGWEIQVVEFFGGNFWWNILVENICGNVIFAFVEPPAFNKDSICQVFEASFVFVFALFLSSQDVISFLKSLNPLL